MSDLISSLVKSQDSATSSTAAVGQASPSFHVKTWANGDLADLDLSQAMAGKRLVIFGLPGAFTNTCSKFHLPGFVQQAEALKKAGADGLLCLSVNDVFVLKTWIEAMNGLPAIQPIADWDAALTKALGLGLDMSARTLGLRCQRFLAIVDDGVIAHVAVEAKAGDHDVSSAEAALAWLEANAT